MTSATQKNIEELWTKKRHGIVQEGSLSYEVCGDLPLRKIKVITRSRVLPVEFYSVKALQDGIPKIHEMLRVGDSRVNTLRHIFDSKHIGDSDASLLLKPAEQFETTFYKYQNNAGFTVVFVLRPSGDLFYQRLSDPSMLAYVLANQVGFLVVTEPEVDVYTSPDKQIEFSLVGENLQIINDFSKE